MYTARKSAQMAAFFAKKQGGRISILKLTKFLYLADRYSIQEYGLPISFDFAVSMPQGPVLTQILNLTNGESRRSDQAQWDEWISDKENHDVCLNRDFEPNDLDQLSDADLEVLELVWADFNHMDRWQLRDYTHTLEEWQDPKGSMIPMSDAARIAAIIGDQEQAAMLADEVASIRQFGHKE